MLQVTETRKVAAPEERRAAPPVPSGHAQTDVEDIRRFGGGENLDFHSLFMLLLGAFIYK